MIPNRVTSAFASSRRRIQRMFAMHAFPAQGSCALICRFAPTRHCTQRRFAWSWRKKQRPQQHHHYNTTTTTTATTTKATATRLLFWPNPIAFLAQSIHLTVAVSPRGGFLIGQWGGFLIGQCNGSRACPVWPLILFGIISFHKIERRYIWCALHWSQKM